MKKYLLLSPVFLIACIYARAQNCSSFQFVNNNDSMSVNLPDSNIFYPSAHGFTWEMWVYPFYIPTGNDTVENQSTSQPFMDASDAVPAEDLCMGIGWGNFNENWLTFAIDGLGGASGRDYNAPHYVLPETNRWYYVAGVCNYDSGYTRLYVDSILVGTSYFMHNTPGFTPMVRNMPVAFGNTPTQLDYQNAFQGMLDEVSVWGYPRTDSSVFADRNTCFSGNEPGLTAYYKADEGTGTFTADKSPNHLNGTLVNGASWSTNCTKACAGGNFSLQAIDTVSCKADTTMLTITGLSGISITPMANIIAANSGTYELLSDSTTTYTVTGTGCSGLLTDKFTVHISSLNDSITADKNIFCANDSSQICSTPGFASYNWNAGNGTGNCIEVTSAGDYYVTVTDANGCTAESNHLSLKVYPVSSVSVVIQGDTLLSYGAVHYQWFLNDTLIPKATNPQYIATTPGLYSVQIIDTNGCTVLSDQFAITGIKDLWDEKNISIYPNPSVGSWLLTVSEELVGSTLQLLDDEGRIVFKSEIRNPKSEIAAGDLPNGIYFLQISSENASITRKVVKL